MNLTGISETLAQPAVSYKTIYGYRNVGADPAILAETFLDTRKLPVQFGYDLAHRLAGNLDNLRPICQVAMESRNPNIVFHSGGLFLYVISTT
jgi:hypothetical protein